MPDLVCVKRGAEIHGRNQRGAETRTGNRHVDGGRGACGGNGASNNANLTRHRKHGHISAVERAHGTVGWQQQNGPLLDTIHGTCTAYTARSRGQQSKYGLVLNPHDGKGPRAGGQPKWPIRNCLQLDSAYSKLGIKRILDRPGALRGIHRLRRDCGRDLRANYYWLTDRQLNLGCNAGACGKCHGVRKNGRNNTS